MNLMFVCDSPYKSPLQELGRTSFVLWNDSRIE